MVSLARHDTDPKGKRYSALTMAFMHACNAATLGDQIPRYGFRMHDYKHAIRNCILDIMLGTSIDDAMASLKDWHS